MSTTPVTLQALTDGEGRHVTAYLARGHHDEQHFLAALRKMPGIDPAFLGKQPRQQWARRLRDDATHTTLWLPADAGTQGAVAVTVVE